MIPGKTNIYAGTLDDTSRFTPTVAIFTRSRQAWGARSRPDSNASRRCRGGD
jgi:hypothetical protein